MEFVVVTFRGYFGQSLPTESSLNTKKIVKCLKGFGHEAEECCIEDIVNYGIDNSKIYILSSHQNPYIKSYFNDVASVLFNDSNCIPAPKYILSHENKGVQKILNDKMNLGLPNQTYRLFPSNIEPHINNVIKVIYGSGSSGVFLSSTSNLLKSFFLATWKSIKMYDIIHYLKIKIKIKASKNVIHDDYYKRYIGYIEQEKISTKGYDYKVLIFMNKVYLLKRFVRSNDFRSSGSGKFEFVEAPENILDFALKFRKKLNVPYASLDVLEDQNGVLNCIEFQCVHFGPYAQINSKYYYEFNGEFWEKKDDFKELESILAESIHLFNLS